VTSARPFARTVLTRPARFHAHTPHITLMVLAGLLSGVRPHAPVSNRYIALGQGFRGSSVNVVRCPTPIQTPCALSNVCAHAAALHRIHAPADTITRSINNFQAGLINGFSFGIGRTACKHGAQPSQCVPRTLWFSTLPLERLGVYRLDFDW